MSRKLTATDVFAELSAPLPADDAHRPYSGPDIELIQRWLEGDDLPRKTRIGKLRTFSVQLRSYALDHPSETLDAIIASVEFKIYQLLHNRKAENEPGHRDPFSGLVPETPKNPK